MYCGYWPSGQKGQNLGIFFLIPKNVSLSGHNGNFDYKFNDDKDETGFPFCLHGQTPTVAF